MNGIVEAMKLLERELQNVKPDSEAARILVKCIFELEDMLAAELEEAYEEEVNELAYLREADCGVPV